MFEAEVGCPLSMIDLSVLDYLCSNIRTFKISVNSLFNHIAEQTCYFLIIVPGNSTYFDHCLIGFKDKDLNSEGKLELDRIRDKLVQELEYRRVETGNYGNFHRRLYFP